MKNQKQNGQHYIINFGKIDGDGAFPCPKCGIMISPDDEKDEVYTIENTIIDNDKELKELHIKCKKCNSVVRLVGFQSE